MKKFFVITVLSIASMNYAMGAQTANSKQQTIKLPSAETINKCLCAEGFDHFVEKSKIGESLGGKELHPLGVALTVELKLHDYSQLLKESPIMATLMQMRKPELLKCILTDFPEAITELEELKLIEK
jgi:hypothetical protein